MVPAPRLGLIALVGAGLACGLTATRRSSADATPSLALEPAPAGDRSFTVERAGIRGNKLLSARLVAEVAREPLVLRNGAQELDPVVSDQVWLHALASFSLAHRFALNVDVPFVPLQSGGGELSSGATAPRAGSGVDLGDVRLGARVKLLGTEDDAGRGAALALASSVWLPTASDGYAGDGAVRVRAALTAEGAGQRLYWAVHGGVRTRPSEKLPGALPTRVGTALDVGLAGGFFADARRDLALGAELAGDLTMGGGARLFDPRATIAHFLLTGHYRIAGGPFEVGGAFGPGLGQGAGAAAWRALALVGFAPERPEPLPDRDEDRVPDRSDACIDLPGFPSRDRLLNGCPPPPPDRDGDAIPDENDACPSVPGEATGSRRTHGCPTPADTDGDGVPDPADACPRERGIPPPAGDGCPKPVEPPRARLEAQEIAISQQVQFETGTAVLRPESDAVLGDVARVLAEHPEVELVEVQGHTDQTGTAEHNRRLGQARADSVVAWLAARGVARERLAAKGYGSDRAIADNATEEGRAKNRRVEFRVIRTKPSAPPAEPAQGGPR
ncbi:OmpA family protein [Sorangium sp. So ce117]|uniref:OmpA family protein n=1 Tax=Sorangium sp. So ce117 TaxID=3133277 RepID=UPI003F5E502F